MRVQNQRHNAHVKLSASRSLESRMRCSASSQRRSFRHTRITLKNKTVQNAAVCIAATPRSTALVEGGGGGGVNVDKMPWAEDSGGVESSRRESSGRPSASAFSASLYSGTRLEVSV